MEINKNFKEATKTQLKQLNPLALAFVGDSVHTSFVRTYVVLSGDGLVGGYHAKSAKFCKASWQSIALDKIYELLTEEEKDIVRRARNTKSNNIAKNSSIEDYKKSTGFEALIGWLYLLKDNERLQQFLKISVQN